MPWVWCFFEVVEKWGGGNIFLASPKSMPNRSTYIGCVLSLFSCPEKAFTNWSGRLF